jgi:ADP-heptose:LPS heptosyltransferase
MAAVIARSRLVIANNSGPMHIADAFKRPAVILFSGTDLESQWRPRGSPVTLLRVPTPCHPCRLFTCPFEMQCLDLAPERVAEAAMQWLSIGATPALSQIA